MLIPETGLVRDENNAPWIDWKEGTSDGAVLRYRTLFSAEETATSGLIQGLLIYPPGARSIAHWHTPVETYYILSGSGHGEIAGAPIRFSSGQGLYVPGRALHWFENDGDAPLQVLWTLQCDAVDDIDFVYVEDAPGAIDPTGQGEHRDGE